LTAEKWYLRVGCWPENQVANWQNWEKRFFILIMLIECFARQPLDYQARF